jgi:SAM-dependent MidA family methyltransferase
VAQEDIDEFAFAVSRGPTPHARLLPTLDPRAAPLLDTPGSTIEMSPESLSLAGDIARHIAPPSSPSLSPPLRARGAALLLDYGTLATLPVATLRGIRAHKLLAAGGAKGALASPGLTDVSAHVDFAGLARAALEATTTTAPASGQSPSEGQAAVEVHGPVTQADWLGALGVRQRGEALERAVAARHAAGGEEAAEEARRRVREGWKRVVDRGPKGMGEVYKAMAIVPAGRREAGGVVGFGGEVVGG